MTHSNSRHDVAARTVSKSVDLPMLGHNDADREAEIIIPFRRP